jgi:DNA-binding CsgD family transcriptional regulator
MLLDNDYFPARAEFLAQSKRRERYGLKRYEGLLREVHPQFSQRLLRLAPDLTPMELKACMLTRLHLRTKDVAELLGVSESSIETHRSHARRKLHISRRQNLVATLHAV